MRLEKTSTLTEVLAQGPLSNLRQRSDLTAQLDKLLGFYLDQRLRQLVHAAAYQNGVLTLTCDNSTVAGQLRYLSRIYIQQLRQHGEFCDLKRITAVITNATSVFRPAKALQPPLRRLSPETAELLAGLSTDLGEGEVSEALRRLARHAVDREEAEKDHSS
jgi:hypothetical protein